MSEWLQQFTMLGAFLAGYGLAYITERAARQVFQEKPKTPARPSAVRTLVGSSNAMAKKLIKPKPKGAVLQTIEDDDDISANRKKKKLFLAAAEKNPLTKLPTGLEPGDFGQGIDPFEDV